MVKTTFLMVETNAGWWFQTCFFHNIWDVILPIDELVFFKMVKTTNQICIYIYMILYDYRLYMCAKVNLSIKLTNLI